VRLLILAPSYPHAGHPFAGLFNERCVAALAEICESIEVVVPRPYCPPGFARLSARWQTYSEMPRKEVRGGVPIWRPAHIQVPWFGAPFWLDQGGFLCVRNAVRAVHRRVKFEAILSFDLLGTGGLAWRIGRDLGIAAAGYATGDDVKVPADSPLGRMVRQAIDRLDLVFYQSRELLERVSSLLAIEPGKLEGSGHIVLPRGVPEPPALSRAAVRDRVRAEWGVGPDRVVVLSVGRIVRDKGVFELLDVLSGARAKDPRFFGVLVGGKPGFDEFSAVEERRQSDPSLAGSVKLLPAVEPERVWELLCAADVFAFTSHREGMPNSLLEAMAMETPTVAFAIPPVREIEGGTGAPVLVPAFQTEGMIDAILRLAASPEERRRVAQAGKARIADRFSVKKNMAAAVEALSSVVASRRSSPAFPQAKRSVG